MVQTTTSEAFAGVPEGGWNVSIAWMVGWRHWVSGEALWADFTLLYGASTHLTELFTDSSRCGLLEIT